MTDRFGHFLHAQDGGTYERALKEISAGQQVSHWMWFVFPQIAGLGSSATARKFALADKDEAHAYCTHEDLGPRLFEATEAVLEWAGTMSAEDIFGPVDAMKFRSSMTLFDVACDDDDDRQVFTDALLAYYGGERCSLTMARL